MPALSRSGQTVGLVVLAVLAVLLGTLSVRHVPSVQGPPATTPLVVESPTSSSPTSSSPTTSSPTASSTTKRTDAALAAVPLTRAISVVSAKAAYRVASGTCRGGGATLEATTDGGATWSARKTPLRAISRVQGTSDTEVFIVGSGTGADCALSIVSSADGGRSWSGPGSIAAVWTRDLARTNRLHIPSDTTRTPCGAAAVVDLTRFGNSQAYVLCADGAVAHTTDGGGGWKASGKVPGAVALMAPTAASPLVLVTGYDGCAGVAVLKVAKATEVGCLEVDLSRVEPGSVTGSATEKTAWVGVGDATYVSADGGAQWRLAKG